MRVVRHCGPVVAIAAACAILSGGCGGGRAPDVQSESDARSKADVERENQVLQTRIRSLEKDLAVTRELLENAESRLRNRMAALGESRDALADAQEAHRHVQREVAGAADALHWSEQKRKEVEARLEATRGALVLATNLLGQIEAERATAQYQLEQAGRLTRVQAEQLLAYEAYVRSLQGQEGSAPRTRPEPDKMVRARLLESRLTPTALRPISRKTFATVVRGMSADELVAYAGAPDSIEPTTPPHYVYRRPLTYAADPAHPDASVDVVVEGGVAGLCLFTPGD
jgi:hypothetical protein